MVTDYKPTFLGAKVLSLSSPLKRDFLFFDQIVSPWIEQQIRFHKDAHVRAEIEWLLEHSLVADLDFVTAEKTYSADQIWSRGTPALGMLLFGAAFALVEANVDSLAPDTVVLKEAGQDVVEQGMHLLGAACQEIIDQSLGAAVSIVRLTQGVQCTPIREDTFGLTIEGYARRAEVILRLLRSLPRQIRRHRLFSKFGEEFEFAKKLPDLRPILAAEKLLRHALRTQSKAETLTTPALEVVLEALPSPDDSVPWEQILEFRGDPGTRHSLLALRSWVRKVSAEQVRVEELREELEFLKSEFERHMRVHKMKSQLATLKAVVTLPAEFLQHLVRLQFGAAIETLFKLREIEIARVEAEMKLPGQEIAYIYKARTAFANG